MDIIFKHRGLFFVHTNINSGQGHDTLSRGGTWEANENEEANEHSFIGMSVFKD